jgi:hypothetical protein
MAMQLEMPRYAVEILLTLASTQVWQSVRGWRCGDDWLQRKVSTSKAKADVVLQRLIWWR